MGKDFALSDNLQETSHQRLSSIDTCCDHFIIELNHHAAFNTTSIKVIVWLVQL
jgi:hypothetical protein